MIDMWSRPVRLSASVTRNALTTNVEELPERQHFLYKIYYLMLMMNVVNAAMGNKLSRGKKSLEDKI